MNKAELIEQITKDTGLTKAQANDVMNSFTNAIVTSLKKGENVTLVGFGTFSVSQRAARNGRNPQTGETIKIKARKLPKFKPGKDFATKVAASKGGKK
jgi:DNA-binding protein HU-beta